MAPLVVAAALAGWWWTRTPVSAPVEPRTAAELARPEATSRGSEPLRGAPTPPRSLAGPNPMVEFVAERGEQAKGWWYEPIPWRPDVPARSSPAGFDAQMQEAFQDCGAGYRYLGSDCAEAPCYAFIAKAADTRSWQGSVGCASWLAAYDDPSITTLGMPIPCDQGEIWLMAVSPVAAVKDALPADPAVDFQLAMDRKIPRMVATLTTERLVELCDQYYAGE
jgi:hypothetical protein